ncbi:MAG: hypothetical protein K6C10_01705 [Prevotella sp.]|nr:hypothetical protein [Prevotella sp.]
MQKERRQHDEQKDNLETGVAILATIAFAVAIYYYAKTDQTLGGLIASMGLAFSLNWVFPKKEASDLDNKEGSPSGKTVDELVSIYGEPDDIVLLNAAKGNDANGVVLVYNARGLLIINGEEVRKSDITEVTFNNAAMAYLPYDYQVMLTTRNKQKPEIHLYVGCDVEWARDVAEEIRKHISL